MTISEQMMLLALAEARKGLGATGANPLVGAVIHRGPRIISRGCHARLGGAHAEVDAISKAGESVAGATLTVNLEPCNHFGRTPPCTRAILEAGLAEVVVGMKDPNPAVAGGGMAALAAAGVKVEFPCLEAECLALNEPFVQLVTKGRPWVVLKLAATLDGRLAAGNGDSRWVSSPAAAEYVHGLRAAADAVLVGGNTARIDDPGLDCRLAPCLKQPLRVVLDQELLLPPEAKMVRSAAQQPVLVFHGHGFAAARKTALEAAGAECRELDCAGAGLSLIQMMRELAARGICRLLVEGGGQLAASLLAAGLVDELHWVLAPKLLGADGIPAVGPLGVQRVNEALALQVLRTQPLGPDLLLVARPANRS